MREITYQAANRRTVTKLVLATCVMFSFGYALVPLYNVFCTITGLNGKTGRLTEAQATLLLAQALALIWYLRPTRHADTLVVPLARPVRA